MLFTSQYEQPCGVQIFGSEPEIMADACQNPLLKKFAVIDINMGCPVPKVVNNGEGCALMSNVKLAEKVIIACVKSAAVPVTVKFRKGINEKNINAVEFAKMCEGAGASLVTVHGRLQTQLYSGKSDRNIIGEVVNSVKIPVVANGDVYSNEDAEALINQTGAAGIMVARGSLGYPQIFSDITGENKTLNVAETIKMHADILKGFMGEKYTCLNLRKHLLWYLNKTSGGKAYKIRAGAVNSLQEIYELIDEAF